MSLLDTFLEQEKMFRMEGRQGVVNLCKVARAIGYKDPTYYGQLASGAVLGDLIAFLEDNPGAIEALVEWVGQQEVPEWDESLQDHIRIDEDDEIDS